MSTGADAKTMPVTPEYADNHERIFGERERPTGERRLFVSRCSKCDGVTHEPKSLLFDCQRCGGKDCYGLVDAATAPGLQEAPRSSLDGIASGRFYDGVRATDGTDIGSRKKHREYKRIHGLADADDYKGQWAKQGEQRERVRRGERGALPSKTRREAIARRLYQIDKP